MKREAAISRRQALARVALGGAALGLAGCDRLSNASESRSILDAAENLTRLWRYRNRGGPDSYAAGAPSPFPVGIRYPGHAGSALARRHLYRPRGFAAR